jgi:plastocyanin
MARKSLVFASLLAAVAITATAAFGQKTGLPTLNGTVGPGYTITLKQNGKVVKNLKAGKYRLVIADKASIHGFSLDGPHGYAKDFTQVPSVGRKTFTVDLKAGSYKYYCPAHESIMFGRFKAS